MQIIGNNAIRNSELLMVKREGVKIKDGEMSN